MLLSFSKQLCGHSISNLSCIWKYSNTFDFFVATIVQDFILEWKRGKGQQYWVKKRSCRFLPNYNGTIIYRNTICLINWKNFKKSCVGNFWLQQSIVKHLRHAFRNIQYIYFFKKNFMIGPWCLICDFKLKYLNNSFYLIIFYISAFSK